ncbi:uncharacterized protein [Argopecten irradians]|uniref:uncharacterized protein n=1 Tax=Argopecten irradians TaxID=31199 RepID=UPI0037229809
MARCWSRKVLWRITTAAIIVCLIGTLLLMFYNVEEKGKTTLEKRRKKVVAPLENEDILAALRKEVDERLEEIKYTESEKSNLTMSEKKIAGKLVPEITLKQKQPDVHRKKEVGDINYNVHIFYYPWYGNPKTDGKYLHWNHPFLPHWNKNEAKKWPSGHHDPPDDIGANFYPQLGPYSSKDPNVVRKHIKDMKYAGIGVVAVSWYPPGDADSEGEEPDKLMPMILNIAAEQGIKITFHIEPYKGRDHLTMKKNLKYIMDTYGNHSAFYRRYHKDKKKMLPMYYIYDSYQVSAKLWADLFSPSGKTTVRGTELDGFFIGLLVEQQHKVHVFSAGFDGFYTYFATNGFTYGSSWDKWKDIQKFAQSHSKMFIPSVGPGYIDTNVRPWNAKNTRNRNSGVYYRDAFEAAFKVKPSIISITSFNEWHEGTQIEPAVSKNTGNSNLRRRTYKSSRPVWDSGNSNPGGVPVASHGGYIPAPTPKPQVRTRTETRIVSDGNGIRQTRIISSGGSFPQTVGGSSRRVIISSSGTGASRDAMMEQMRKMIKEQHDRIRSEGGNGKFTITSHTSHIIQGAPQVVQGPAPAPQPKPYKSTKPLTPSKFTPQEQATLLRYHNDVRQHLDPPPKVMEQMKWSDVLAGKAQEYAEKCEWRHSDKSTRKDQLGYSFVGENLYVSTEYSVTKSVKSWADEKAFYDFWANTCVPGEQCGHYTQMIWATTNMVGCGIHFCKTVAFWRRGDAYYVVCNYGPGGNLNGARPYEAKTSRSSNTVQSVNGWGSQTIRKTDQKTWNQQTGTSRDVQNNEIDKVAPLPRRKRPDKSSKSSKFSPKEQAILLQYHNDVRQDLNPVPKVMEKMRWSDELASKAQEYAEKCEWRHSPKSGRRDKLGYRFIGENLYISTSYGVTKSVKSWADEKAFYDYWTNTCVPGQQCGHYTQMIWGTTNMVGCGIHFCKEVGFWRRGNAHYVVCHYGPGGNINGARPYEAKTGDSGTGSNVITSSKTTTKSILDVWKTNTENSGNNGYTQRNGIDRVAPLPRKKRPGTNSGSKFTPEEQAILLQYHNDVRQNLTPTPKVMKKMKWSNELAAKAQEYAEKCEWRHSPKSGRRKQLGYRFIGENLYISTSYEVTKSVKSWADEKAFYDYLANTCVPGQQCGHYTQMIWGNTDMVGCGIHFCKEVGFWRRGDAYYVVCNYGPGGNINGARPYEAKSGGNGNKSDGNWRKQTTVIRRTKRRTSKNSRSRRRRR